MAIMSSNGILASYREIMSSTLRGATQSTKDTSNLHSGWISKVQEVDECWYIGKLDIENVVNTTTVKTIYFHRTCRRPSKYGIGPLVCLNGPLHRRLPFLILPFPLSVIARCS